MRFAKKFHFLYVKKILENKPDAIIIADYCVVNITKSTEHLPWARQFEISSTGDFEIPCN